MKMLNKEINNMLQDCDDLEKKLAKVQASSMSSTDKATHLNEMINVEENLHQAKLMESDTSQDTLYSYQAIVSELENVMKTIEMEISCSNTASKHLRKQVDNSLHENAFQQENVYDLSYRSNEMEVKISGLEGTSKLTEENEKMNIKISQLENSLAEHIDVKNFLQTQVTKLEDEMRRLSNTIIADNERIQVLRGKLQDQVMLFEGGVKQTAVAKLKSQQKQVDESVLRLRVSQLGEAISTEETSIYDLQKFRLALETEIGWTDGFNIPVANAENQALEEELRKLTVRKSQAKAAYDEAQAKFDALDKHLKYVNQESEQNQKLLTAYLQQLTTERRRLKQTKAENDRINQERRLISKHMEEIYRRQEDKKNDLSKALNKIEKLKAETTWDAEALKAWEESLKRRDDDTDLLKNFSKIDERRAKDLDARRQNLQTEVGEKRKTVEKMVSEIINYEQMQDRTDKLFKQQEEERKSLVFQWQEAVKNLRQRDDDIAKTNTNIVQTKALIAQKQEELDEQDTFLKNEIANNKTLEMEIEGLNGLNSRMRRELNEIVQETLTMGNEVHTVKRSLAATASKLEHERRISKKQNEDLEAITAKIAGGAAENEELKRKLEDVLSSTMSSSERTKRLEQMILVGQEMTKNVLLDAEKVQGVLYRNQIYVEELKEASVAVQTQISGLEISRKHLDKQIKNKLDEIAQQKEMIYSLEYRINEIEVKIGFIEGQSKVDEKSEMMNAKIAELEATLNEHNDVKNFLQAQITRLEDEMRRLGSAIAADAEKLHILKGKLQDQILLFDGGLKQAAAAKLKAQHKQVEENVLRLRVTQLGKAISKEENSIYDLQKFRLQLETSLREREIEIQAHKDVLEAKKRNLEEARGRLRADINHKKIRIDQFQKKHHLTLMALGTDDEGQPLSITHFKIKDAQERYMLQQEGDELDNKIKRAEKEIIAMENTLKVVNMTNTIYKKTLSPSEKEDENRTEIKNFEQEICNTILVIKQQKKALSEKRKIFKSLQEAVLEVQKRYDEEQKKFEEIYTSYERLKGEHTPRDFRLAKTMQQVKLYKKRISDHVDLATPERNLEIQQLQDANKEAFHQLRILMMDHPDTTEVINNLLEKYGLEMPSGPASCTSSTSTVSSKTSRSSTSGSSGDSNSALTPVLLTFDPNVKKPRGRKGQ